MRVGNRTLLTSAVSCTLLLSAIVAFGAESSTLLGPHVFLGPKSRKCSRRHLEHLRELDAENQPVRSV